MIHPEVLWLRAAINAKMSHGPETVISFDRVSLGFLRKIFRLLCFALGF